MSESERRRPRWITVLLVLLPLWLFGSGAAALWYYFYLERKDALVEQERFGRAVSAKELADDLRKIVEIIGERNTSTEAAAEGLSRTASMIEGLLGPTNTGYTVRRHTGPSRWPILQVTLTGKVPQAPAIWVLTSYDSPAGSRGAEANASGLAATLAAAQALAGDKSAPAVHFVFLPHVNEKGSPTLETARKFSEIVKAAGTPGAMLSVEAMGDGETLWFSSLDETLDITKIASGLGKIYGPDVVHPNGETDLAATLVQLGLPAVRISTRAAVKATEEDSRMPFAPTVAASTGRLIELIRRCTGNLETTR
jgi:hypothetical protein